MCVYDLHATHTRAFTHARTLTHILSTWGTNMKAQRRRNAHTYPTLTVKPFIMSDTTVSSTELIASKHAAVPHVGGVWRQSSISAFFVSPEALSTHESLYFPTIP